MKRLQTSRSQGSFRFATRLPNLTFWHEFFSFDDGSRGPIRITYLSTMLGTYLSADISSIAPHQTPRRQ